MMNILTCDQAFWNMYKDWGQTWKKETIIFSLPYIESFWLSPYLSLETVYNLVIKPISTSQNVPFFTLWFPTSVPKNRSHEVSSEIGQILFTQSSLFYDEVLSVLNCSFLPQIK